MSVERNELEINVKLLNFTYYAFQFLLVFLWVTGQLNFITLGIIQVSLNFIMLFHNNIIYNLYKNNYLASDRVLMRKIGIFT